MIKSTMGLSRQFLNLIVSNHNPAVKSLSCMHLEHLFSSPTTSPQAPGATSHIPAAGLGTLKNEAAADLMMEKIQLRHTEFTFGAATTLVDQRRIDCFPLMDSTMICADQLGHAFCLDLRVRLVGSMPSLHKPKSMPISLFVAKPDIDKDFSHEGGGSSLLVMERIPKPEVGCSTQYSDQFEAFVFGRTTKSSLIKSWQCHQLPPLPYVRDPKYCHSRSEISSYAVLEGGSQVCISVKGVGSYFLDTANHTWSEVRNWTLPFHGKVEYVPELKLWFGLSAESQHLAAADLSNIFTLDSKPQLVDRWKELVLPEDWKECRDSQLVSLGSGIFCIARFFQSMTSSIDFGNEYDQNFAVFTGVKLETPVLDAYGSDDSSGNSNVNGSNRKAELRMTPYKSIYHMDRKLNKILGFIKAYKCTFNLVLCLIQALQCAAATNLLHVMAWNVNRFSGATAYQGQGRIGEKNTFVFWEEVAFEV
ncbi:hypothetical protein QOZ80_7AG0577100 [Eleusine coracana subsp. coracana]|nr:hypothetical protein QOZ80_7AG0577100 [Eleusine coracana subsp. coracana]